MTDMAAIHDKLDELAIHDKLDELTDTLRGDLGSDYAIGWMKGMLADLMRDPDIKLTKKQRAAFGMYVQTNIDWAQQYATKRSFHGS